MSNEYIARLIFGAKVDTALDPEVLGRIGLQQYRTELDDLGNAEIIIGDEITEKIRSLESSPHRGIGINEFLEKMKTVNEKLKKEGIDETARLFFTHYGENDKK